VNLSKNETKVVEFTLEKKSQCFLLQDQPTKFVARQKNIGQQHPIVHRARWMNGVWIENCFWFFFLCPIANNHG